MVKVLILTNSMLSCPQEKTQRVRRRLQVDDELRGRLLLGAAVAAGAALLGTGGWFLFKRRGGRGTRLGGRVICSKGWWMGGKGGHRNGRLLQCCNGHVTLSKRLNAALAPLSCAALTRATTGHTAKLTGTASPCYSTSHRPPLPAPNPHPTLPHPAPCPPR